MPSTNTPILVIEDGDEDFDLLRYAFEACGVTHPLVQCRHARDAMALFEQPAGSGHSLPCFIFLDLNLPDIDGRELLTLLRQNSAAKLIPILIFSTSNYPHDVRHCYANGANGYLVKPIGIVGLKKLVTSFKDFWLHTAELPQ